MQQEIKKKEYLNYLTAECQKILITKDMKILTFLYKVIFDEKYYHLTRILKYPEHFLNYEIGRIILYPYENYMLQNTATAITLIPAFVSFYIGQGLILHEFLKVDVDNIWDIFLTGIAYKINDDIELADTHIDRFLQNLEKESKQFLAMDLEKTLSSIYKYINSKEMLKLLNLMFFQDCLMFVVNSKDISNGYLQFLAEKKKLIIINTFQYLKKKYEHEIGQQIEFYKMKVAISFLENDYNFSYICQGFDHLQAGMVIFSLIQLDYRQFQNFYSLIQSDLQMQFLNQIISIAGNQETYFYRLLLVGKCLSKLRFWEDAINIFNLLLNQINSHPNKDQYKMYIKFKLCKIALLQGETKGLLKKLSTVSQMIDQYKEKKLEFFQTNPQKCIQNHCLFLQLLLSTYYNERDRMRTVLIKISTINIHSDSINQRRAFSLLQFEFIKLINHFGAIFRDKKGEKQLDHILSEIQSACFERQSIQKSTGIFFFLKRDKRYNNSYSIPNYFQAVEELLIINVLLRNREIYMLQYLNPQFYSIFKLLFKQNDFFEIQLQAQICFFLHDFDKALELALKIKDYKLIGHIYEYQNRFDEAIEQYKKVLSPSCFFNCAILQRYKGEFSTAYEGFKNLELSQNQYQLICQMFKDDLRKKQNLSDISERQSMNFSDVSSQQFKSQKSLNLTSSVRERNRKLLLEDQETSIDTNVFKSDYPVSKNQNQYVESILETSDFNPNFSDEQIDEEPPALIKQYSKRFNFALRPDIEFFYINLVKDLTTEGSSLWQTLGDFVEKTKQFTIESQVLFEKKYPYEIIGQGGNSQVFRFEFQGQIYAAKIMTLSYDGTGENTSNELKQDIERKLIEICILCDVTKSNIKYVIKLRHIGFRFERVGYTTLYHIVLLTDFYQKHQIMQNWDMQRKIKYAFKLSRALYSLQNDLKVLHLDLKPDNVMVDEATDSPIIIDFGLSKKFIESIRGQSGVKECTYRYLDPDLLKKNFSSRKNDVYSFGASLYQYITNDPPYKALNDYQLVGLDERFSSYHEKQLESIENVFLRQLIKDCTCPIETRITFLEVLGRLFQYLYRSKVESVRQLIAILFDHYYQRQKQQQKVQLHILLLKQFVKRSNEFIPQVVPNQQSMVFTSTYDQFSNVFVEIIQRIKQFVNWVKLAPIKGVNKLVDFRINFKQIQNICKNIEFVFTIQTLQPLEIIDKSALLQIAKIIKTIHEQHICLLIIPREYIYQIEGEITLENLSFSQDLSIEIDNLYPLKYELIDPSIQETKQFDFSNDVYAFGKLLRNIHPELAERCLHPTQKPSFKEIIEILNN